MGPSALLVGTRYCKERRALLIVDPPSNWHTADDALRGMRDWNLCSENALMYFPRVLAHDKLRGHFESFAACGAVAGMLARCDEAAPLWVPTKNDEAVLRPGYRPTCLVTEDRRIRLATLGVNTIQAVRSAARIGVAARTLAAGAAANGDWQYLAPRRLALNIVNSIERGTRWAAIAQQPGPRSRKRRRPRCAPFSRRCTRRRRSVSGAWRMSFFVISEQRGTAEQPGELQLVIGFAARARPGFHCFRIAHSAVRQPGDSPSA